MTWRKNELKSERWERKPKKGLTNNLCLLTFLLLHLGNTSSASYSNMKMCPQNNAFRVDLSPKAKTNRSHLQAKKRSACCVNTLPTTVSFVSILNRSVPLSLSLWSTHAHTRTLAVFLVGVAHFCFVLPSPSFRHESLRRHEQKEQRPQPNFSFSCSKALTSSNDLVLLLLLFVGGGEEGGVRVDVGCGEANDRKKERKRRREGTRTNCNQAHFNKNAPSYLFLVKLWKV